MQKVVSIIAGLFILFAGSAGAEWFKGNTHTHTTLSDGDSPPETVARWYKDHGYRFLAITDHNKNADVAGLNASLAEEGKFIVIPGNEISCQSEGKPVHLTALNVTKPLQPYNEDTIIKTLQRNVDSIRAAGALAFVNHPNFIWAFGAKELGHVKGVQFLEIWNSHPIVNNLGGDGFQSTEEMWDTLLSKGQHIWCVASDDTHALKDFTPRHANPGRGWITVRCDRLAPEDIMSALERGDFYSSTGVELSDVSFDGKTFTVTVKAEGKTQYLVEFIGRGGKVLSRGYNPSATYPVKGAESYIRARITDSNGLRAWTQPVFPGK